MKRPSKRSALVYIKLHVTVDNGYSDNGCSDNGGVMVISKT